MFHFPGSDRAIKKAYQHATAGKVEEAVTMLRRAAHGADPEGLRTEAMGMILYQAGRWPEAAQALQNALQIRPSDAQRLFYAASATARAGDWDTALRLLEEAANRNPSDAGPLASKCLILLERTDTPSALAAYEAARQRFDAKCSQDSYSMGLLEQCAESIAGLPRNTDEK